MNKTRLSLLYLGSYLVLIGLGLLFAPESTLRLLQSNAEYGNVFPRIAGMLMSGLGLAWIPMEGEPDNIHGRIFGENPGFSPFPPESGYVPVRVKGGSATTSESQSSILQALIMIRFPLKNQGPEDMNVKSAIVNE